MAECLYIANWSLSQRERETAELVLSSLVGESLYDPTIVAGVSASDDAKQTNIRPLFG